jgi:hypothetical protein
VGGEFFPKIFDRTFVIAYLLPAASVLSACLWWLEGIDPLTWGRSHYTQLPLGVLLSLGALVLAILLMVLNREILQLLEGYPLQRFSCFGRKQREIFFTLLTCKRNLDEDMARYDNPDNIPQSLIQRRAQAYSRLAEDFPGDEAYLLPTRFGNTVRAFEVYSAIEYGLDSIEGWVRLLAIMPKDYRELIDSVKSETDFWVNIWFLALLMGGYSAVLSTCRLCGVVGLPSKNGYITAGIILCISSFIVAWIAARIAPIAAKEWGSTVKSAFDVFLPVLAKQMDIHSHDPDIQRRRWEDITQRITYREVKVPKPQEQPNNVTRNQVVRLLGTPDRVEGGLNDPTEREEFGIRYNEKWIYDHLHSDPADVANRIIYWQRYGFIATTVRADETHEWRADTTLIRAANKSSSLDPRSAHYNTTHYRGRYRPVSTVSDPLDLGGYVQSASTGRPVVEE